MPKDKAVRYYHRKLVRDRIPEIIKFSRNRGEIRILGEQEFRKRIREKLVEEVEELRDKTGEDLTNELADVLQLIRSIADFEGIDFKEVEDERKRKENKRGVFNKRIFLIWSNKPSGNK